MVTRYIPIFAFLILLLLTIPFSLDFATSVVPGWHTTIFPPYFFWGLGVTVVLILTIIGYWLLRNRNDKINWALFAGHFVLTVPTIIYLKFPGIFLQPQLSDEGEWIKAIEFRIRLIPIIWTLFIIGQTLFLVYYVRSIRKRRI
ncbi:MAG: hypothetical protein ACTHMM_13760 [Agriterribacter sp.]